MSQVSFPLSSAGHVCLELLQSMGVSAPYTGSSAIAMAVVVPVNYIPGLAIMKPRPNLGKRTVCKKIVCEMLDNLLSPTGPHLSKNR